MLPAATKLITAHFGKSHVSLDTVREAETIFLEDPLVFEPSFFNEFFTLSSYCFWCIEAKLGLNANLSATIFKYLFPKRGHFFTILMGANFRKCFPWYQFPGLKCIYLFDAWPDFHTRIARFATAFHIDFLFVSSSQAAETLKVKLPKTRCYWIPEGVDSSHYTFKAYENKDIDVLALGRRDEHYHGQIVNTLQSGGKIYLFEKEKGQLVFDTRDEFVTGLARTKLSICIPSNRTHPERSGNFETMTVRYLQSMASKCLIVGHAPAEMIQIFGYNPVIEIDSDNPEKQILNLLENYKSYIPFIEKNYTEVMANHTWQNRWNQISAILKGNQNPEPTASA